MKTLVGLVFAAILTPLGLRLVLPYISLPDVVQPFEGLLVLWTDLLALPFRALDVGSLVGGFLPAAGPLAQLDQSILAALIGWSVVQLVVMGALAVVRRR